MNVLSIPFETAGRKYALWVWKGDYWNLNSGGEIGLYEYDEDYNSGNQGDIEHYRAIDFEVPMTLSLYEYHYDKTTLGSYETVEAYMDNMFHWYPEEEQWWITGFTGRTQKEFIDPEPDLMVLIGTVDLSERPDMYEGLKNVVFDRHSNDYDFKKHIIFDDSTRKVWINFWGKGVK